MSSAHRGQQRRMTRALVKGELGEDVGVVAGWCAGEEDLDEARRQTHDALIKIMGERRVGGVGWNWSTGPTAMRFLERMKVGASARLRGYYLELEIKLLTRGGYLVVASAPGRSPSIEEPAPS